jgi:hypothetical protein
MYWEVRMTSIVEQILNPRMTFKCGQREYMQIPVRVSSYCLSLVHDKIFGVVSEPRRADRFPLQNDRQKDVRCG